MSRVKAAVEHFFTSEAGARPGDEIVVAFSGGGDSTALLAALRAVGPSRGWRLHAAHLDHGLDAGSAGRAEHARRLTSELGVSLSLERREIPAASEPSGPGGEAEARETRYRFLEEVRRDRGARFVATAHHLDDQAETVLLRLLFGSGIEGLAGIRPLLGPVVRPVLGLRRRELHEELRDLGVPPVEDPTNFDPKQVRNRLRHGVLPYLRGDDRWVDERLARLAATVQSCQSRLESTLSAELQLRVGAEEASIGRQPFTLLPREVQPLALALLHRRAGAPYPASAAACGELRRQLGQAHRIGCDCGRGWRWETSGDRLVARRLRAAAPVFTYTLEVPGVVHIPELSLGFRLSQGPVAPWMYSASAQRAGLALPLKEGAKVTIRTRRPGDRIRPFGCPQSRRLKDLLIKRRVPAAQRGKLPLLCVDDTIAWVPGVTIDERCRLTSETTAWIAETLPA